MTKTGSSKLLFGLHIHQPVDNLSEALHNAVTQCYEPLFATLRRYPDFKFSLHCSGWLLETLKEHYPTTFEHIGYLSDQGSVEFFGGGYYEPILASIPSKDRIAQIRMLSEKLTKEFGAKVKGLWLTERVWESGIVPQLVESGIEYVMVDDYHFLASGFDQEELDGYYYTEEGGQKIALFPISKALRYAIPFYEVERAIQEIEAKELAIIFDDGEKFGLWPNTYEWVYKQKWLERFIEAILQSSIRPIHYSEALENRPKGIAYLANVSYYEMGEWSLRAKDALELERLKKMVGEEYFEKIGIKFIRGGIWKNFFIKYEESNRLHKRMLYMSQKLQNEDLFRLQTNDVYWHGIFGGLYLPNLRDNAYRYLCRCEKRVSGDGVWDLDMDGYEEVQVTKEGFVWRWYEKYGGQLIELLDLKKEFNFQNTLTRRFEAYHEEIIHPKTKELPQGVATIHDLPHQIDEQMRSKLFFDWYTKNSFIDHICDESLSLYSFEACNFKEFGDFANQPFTLEEPLTFRRDGGIYQADQAFATTLSKSYRPTERGLEFAISLQTQSPHLYRYGLECNLHFAHYNELRINDNPIGEGLELLGKEFTIHDPFTQRRLIFTFSKEMEALFVPLRTLSQNEKGFELTWQGISFVFIHPFQNSLKLKGNLCLR